MHENRHLRAALRARAEAGKHLSLHVESARGARSSAASMASWCRSTTAASLRAPLLVAAEGRNSPTREAAGIRVARWKYDHAAIVSTLRHELPHDHVAYEIFYPAGPVRAAADDRRRRRPPLGDRLVGRQATTRPGCCR